MRIVPILITEQKFFLKGLIFLNNFLILFLKVIARVITISRKSQGKDSNYIYDE